ncbi:hypothetical protein RHMOL_Rhmol09G0135400 [Rhododendron molle]|uniref:Uncharacterized protein n=2 Tax=Rhododendron molle TaxID=49168 RepID=A0ACC0MD07_RHOML|nr:hypothetical protein RHMOL_Rhmol09G0135400 [Rhododendron molle]KAI8538850.1 hypothetical protein RHMOL_Rhmol09G0135400 [Rhododendron molle]
MESAPCLPSFSLNILIENRYKKRRWDLKQLVGSGGMPSSHLATVTSLATAVGFHDDFGGSPFATTTTNKKQEITSFHPWPWGFSQRNLSPGEIVNSPEPPFLPCLRTQGDDLHASCYYIDSN